MRIISSNVCAANKHTSASGFGGQTDTGRDCAALLNQNTNRPTLGGEVVVTAPPSNNVNPPNASTEAMDLDQGVIEQFVNINTQPISSARTEWLARLTAAKEKESELKKKAMEETSSDALPNAIQAAAPLVG